MRTRTKITLVATYLVTLALLLAFNYGAHHGDYYTERGQ